MLQLHSGYKGNHKSIYHVPIGDIHFGNKFFNKELLDKALRFIDANRNRCRILLMGDILELATKTSVGRGVYDEAYNTQRQFDVAVETFKPYADLIDIVVEGNHEERIIRDTSFEIVQEFCHRIGRPDAYAKFHGVLNTKVGDHIYSAYVFHGATGGGTDAACLNAMTKLREKAITHLYYMGHTHKLLHNPKILNLPNPDPNSTETIKMEQLFVNTGTALGEGGYGDQKGLPYNRVGFCAIQLFADERKMVHHYIDDLI